jgi:thiamine-phosphate pyrophosphorylase
MRGLYLITPDWEDTGRLLEVTEAALSGGVALLQYRQKDASLALRFEQATALLSLCRRFSCPLIINDHVDLCMDIDADGVHVGGTDASVAIVRGQLGAEKIVGASCYGDLGLAYTAFTEGASYVAFGGFYPSRVKKYPVTTAVGILAASHSYTPLPVIAIGGMTPVNAQPLVEAGADMIAAISSVYLADNPRQAAAAFSSLFAQTTESLESFDED